LRAESAIRRWDWIALLLHCVINPLWLGDSPAGQQALERAIACARQAGSRRAQMQTSFWLARTFYYLPIPADAAIPRAEQLLQTADGEPWAEAGILTPLSVLCAYADHFADARDAIARARSVYDSSGTKIRRAMGADVAGEVELIAGDPAAAEQHLREAYEAYRAMGARRRASTLTGTPPRSRRRPRPLSPAPPPTPAASRPERPGGKRPGMSDLRAATRPH
jgi:hypothetical protein